MVIYRTVVSYTMKTINGNIYKEIEIGSISGNGNVIAKETYRGHHIHVIDDSDTTDNLQLEENHLVRLETRNGERKINPYIDELYLNGVITGFESFEDEGVEKSLSSQREWLSSLKPGRFFKGTISKITESEDRVIEVDSEYTGAVIVSKGKPGDVVEVRLTKTADENFYGNVVEFCNKKRGTHQISDEDRMCAQRKFKDVQYDSDRNDLLNGKL